MHTDFAPPPDGLILSWQKSREVRVAALLPSGVWVEVPSYDDAARLACAPGAKHIRGGLGWGAEWLPPNIAIDLAAASVAALDVQRAQADRDAEAVIALVAAYAAAEDSDANDEQYLRVAASYGWPATQMEAELARRKTERVASRADGWIRLSDSTCSPVQRLHDYGYAALEAALLRRGLVLVWSRRAGGNPDGWRLTDPETAILASLAEVFICMVWACGPVGRTHVHSSLATWGERAWLNVRNAWRPERVSGPARDRAAWAAVLAGAAS
jgi:hypothetical protein